MRKIMAMRTLTAFYVGVAAILSLASAADAASANPMLHAANATVVDERGQALRLHCVNLSPWLMPEGYLIAPGSLAALTTSPTQIKERLANLVGRQRAAVFWRDWTNAFIDEADFRHLKDQGFNCVRLPLNAKSLANRIGDDNVDFDPDGIAPVDNAITWGAATGIYVMLDLHAAPGGQNELATVADVPSDDRMPKLWKGPTAADNQRKTIALWRALAARYSDAQAVGGYDLLNEPALPQQVAGTALARLYGEIIAAIRSVDSRHMIVIEGNAYAHDFATLQSLPDENLLYEFHEYSLGNPAWASPNADGVEPFLRLRQVSGKPLWLGEFGENTLVWHTQVVRLLAAHDIGWAVWPWKRVDPGTHNPVIETIEMPASWQAVANYLVGRWFTRKPGQAEVETAMAQMLVAIRTRNCREDRSLERLLSGN